MNRPLKTIGFALSSGFILSMLNSCGSTPYEYRANSGSTLLQHRSDIPQVISSPVNPVQPTEKPVMQQFTAVREEEPVTSLQPDFGNSGDLPDVINPGSGRIQRESIDLQLEDMDLPVMKRKASTPKRAIVPRKGVMYKVRKGDMVSRVAQRHGVKTSAVLKANGLSAKQASRIRIGQEIFIPGVDKALSPKIAAKVAQKTQLTGGLYVVRKGDVTSVIAQRFKIKTADLHKANNLTMNSARKIRVGQKLVIPGKTPAQITANANTSTSRRITNRTTTTALPDGGKYKVQSGDFPGKIAQKFGIKTSDLMRANNITNSKGLQIGQELVIPGKTITQQVKPENITPFNTEDTPIKENNPDEPKEVEPEEVLAGDGGEETFPVTSSADKLEYFLKDYGCTFEQLQKCNPKKLKSKADYKKGVEYNIPVKG